MLQGNPVLTHLSIYIRPPFHRSQALVPYPPLSSIHPVTTNIHRVYRWILTWQLGQRLNTTTLHTALPRHDLGWRKEGQGIETRSPSSTQPKGYALSTLQTCYLFQIIYIYIYTHIINLGVTSLYFCYKPPCVRGHQLPLTPVEKLTSVWMKAQHANNKCEKFTLKCKQGLKGFSAITVPQRWQAGGYLSNLFWERQAGRESDKTVVKVEKWMPQRALLLSLLQLPLETEPLTVSSTLPIFETRMRQGRK